MVLGFEYLISYDIGKHRCVLLFCYFFNSYGIHVIHFLICIMVTLLAPSGSEVNLKNVGKNKLVPNNNKQQQSA